MENQDHPLKLYDSLKREVRQFVPQDAANVTMYNCGPTVYSYAHIGNARAAVVADVLFRVLRHIYGDDHVRYARNLTDVDDRIIASAMEQGVPISAITEKFTKIYQDDLTALNCLPPTVEPKATEHIQGMADIIVTLLEKGIAYATSQGHVMFDVSKFDEYGKLSRRKFDDESLQSRVQSESYKRNPSDFVLWKIKSEESDIGWSPENLESFLSSNWQRYANQEIKVTPGRPGWHIECSAMAKETLGETIDIHCGGIDLKFPHHENEIAQSECANETVFANYWVHNEFLNMGKEKMSKSVGNVVLVHDLLKDWDGEVIRLALLKAHYRNELIWSEDLLRESKAQLDGWYRVKKEAYDAMVDLQDDDHKFIATIGSDYFRDRLHEDISVNFALIAIVEQRDDISMFRQTGVADSKEYSKQRSTQILRIGLVYCLSQIGLLQHDPEDWFRGNASADDSADFDALAAARHAARQAKDWAEADRIRDAGTARGIIFEDSADGTSWRKA